MHKFFKKTLALLGSVMMLLTTCPTSVFATSTNTPLVLEPGSVLGWPTAPSMDSGSVVLMDLDSGTTLASKTPHTKVYPAGLTKIMTALVAIEHADLFEYVTFSENAVHDDESLRWVQVDEKMTLEDCLYALMLSPSNEISIGIAEHISYDMEQFVDLMNQTALNLGCTDTNFTNPNGLHDDDHYTTAHDFALIAQAAYKYPALQKIFGTTEYTISATNKTNTSRTLSTRHQMLGEGDDAYEFCTGGKSGFTNEAKNTLLTYAEQDGKRLVCIAMNAKNSDDTYYDTKSLFNYGFDNFQNIAMYRAADHPETRMLYPNLYFGRLITLEANTLDCLLTLPLTAPSDELESEIVTTDTNIEKHYKYNGYVVGTQKLSLYSVRTILTQSPRIVAAKPSPNTATPTPTPTVTEEPKNIFQSIPWFVYVLIGLFIVVIGGFIALYLWVSYQRELIRQKRLKRKRMLRKKQEEEERQRQHEAYIVANTPRRRKNSSYYNNESATTYTSREYDSYYYTEEPTSASSRRRNSSYYEDEPAPTSSRRRSSSYYEDEPAPTSSRRRNASYYEEASATATSRRRPSSYHEEEPASTSSRRRPSSRDNYNTPQNNPRRR